MLKHLLLLVLCSITAAIAFGQGVQNGVVYENKTRVVLQSIKVENLSTHKFRITDKSGVFSIEGKAGELLVFSGYFYKSDTVLLTGNKPLEIFLTPRHNMLNEVNVTATEAIHTGSFLAPEYHNQTMVYQRDARYGNYKGGIALRLHYFKKDEKRKAKQAEFLKDQEQQDEIAKVFNADNISKYLPLKGKDMDDFLVLYTPSPMIYFSKDFNLLVYLDTNYKAFLKIPADKRNTQLEQ